MECGGQAISQGGSVPMKPTWEMGLLSMSPLGRLPQHPISPRCFTDPPLVSEIQEGTRVFQRFQLVSSGPSSGNELLRACRPEGMNRG